MGGIILKKIIMMIFNFRTLACGKDDGWNDAEDDEPNGFDAGDNDDDADDDDADDDDDGKKIVDGDDHTSHDGKSGDNTSHDYPFQNDNNDDIHLSSRCPEQAMKRKQV